ncbi:pyrroline-5-carboxylate reductase [Marinivivus vitaminiproducens]|uniref:pyrroline-5-carboxylate reductase n=1 Tax=Marinivivus vitaminiproducens TaxID=3035935 RepID=UPI0027A643CB|nr:pyrroline-5-carboxylate reductase [Geminicoccaceae bacterium SCSIO 64248]
MTGLAGPLVLVGCGKMGGALLQGWLERGLDPASTYVIEPDEATRASLAERGVRALGGQAELPPDLVARAIVFAIKPQMMGDALPGYHALVGRGGLVVSIAAGTLARRFTDAFGEDTPVVRAMPNTPAAIGKGASVLWSNARASPGQRDLAAELLAAVGTVDWIEDEDLMHAVTAMSGGGPAYVFLLIEALATAGRKAGLPEALATSLARTTVIGAGALAAAGDEPPSTLRQNVTSPGGTTQAALGVLMAEPGIQALFDRAIAAGAARSQELA